MSQQSAVDSFPLYTQVDVLVGLPQDRIFYRAYGEVIGVDRHTRTVKISKVFAKSDSVGVGIGSVVTVRIHCLH